MPSSNQLLTILISFVIGVVTMLINNWYKKSHTSTCEMHHIFVERVATLTESIRGLVESNKALYQKIDALTQRIDINNINHLENLHKITNLEKIINK